ncbi:MAG TPA: hypothetical protein VFL36_06965 [Myxococcales bacterium]|nr:hypothetical protein [Myxococcales bacterium]
MLALLLAAGLGSSNFTATGPVACRRSVLEGVLALHSFMYEDARASFEKAEKEAPCPIAFWGEAMTYDHPLWDQQDAPAARAALARIPADARVSPAEAGLIEAARALYSGGHEAWRERLARLHRELPRDDEVALFYALSLYATSGHGKDVGRAMHAAAIAMDVFERNPDHPGAAHYLIHACDSPDHAILALKAARKYAQIAPAASHALHMPSHIFVQLGMWADVERSNAAAFAASQKHGRPDWHSFSWLADARVELGRPDEVLPMIEQARKEAPARVAAELAGLWLSATGQWARTGALLKGLPEDATARVRLDAAAAQGDEASVAAAGVHDERLVAAKKLVAHSVRDPGSLSAAIDAVRALADAEDQEPVSGPAFALPAREELGDLLSRSHRFAEAEKAFEAALRKRPGRRHALQGLGLAARGAGDRQAAADADAALPAQRE